MAKRIVTLCFILLAAGVCAVAQAEQSSQVKAIGVVEAIGELPDSLKTPNRYALIIGVGQYEDSRIPKLSACPNDAHQLHHVLTDPSVGMFPTRNVTLLLDKNVTRNRVVDALDMLGRKAGKEDLVIVFFSGHGAVDEKGRSYWVMHDSKIDRLRATALAETEITELLGEIRTTRLVTLIDACYSASTANLGKSKSLLDLKKIYPKFTGDGRVAITASKGDQLSVVISDKNHPGKGHSAFTWHLIRAMTGLGDLDKDGVVTVNELWSYVKDRTEITARQQGGNQQPQLKGQIGSKFLLTVDSQRLVTNSQQIRQSLETLKKLFMNDSIDSDIYQEGKKLLTSREGNLDWLQQQRKRIYIDLVSGELKPKYLQSALDAIETPAQRAVRLQREVKERVERIKQANIKELLSLARSNDNKIDGKNALESLKELLTLDPGHAEALVLQKKISRYYSSNPGDVMTNSIGMKLVYIPAGEFMMGSPSSESERYDDEGPQHRVKIGHGFYMGMYEVTQGQWKKVMGNNPSYFKGDNNPVEGVSWNDAVKFCKKLSQGEGRTYRLPTEAQWEYACRAGSTTVFSFGDNESSLGDSAWYIHRKTHPVGQKKANAFGLYDMHGNVWEWCSDWYEKDYYTQSPTSNPTGPTRGSSRVLRGGGWIYNAYNCRSANRGRLTPGIRGYDVGFRVVLSVSSQDF